MKLVVGKWYRIDGDLQMYMGIDKDDDYVFYDPYKMECDYTIDRVLKDAVVKEEEPHEDWDVPLNNIIDQMIARYPDEITREDALTIYEWVQESCEEAAK